MGMYTQVRGWLNVNSINHKNIEPLSAKFNLMKNSYNATPRAAFVTQDTYFKVGSNETAFIFIGTELKNYGEDVEKWIEHLLENFPMAEGAIYFQYEEREYSDIWYVRKGKVVLKTKAPVSFEGYGNNCDDMEVSK